MRPKFFQLNFAPLIVLSQRKQVHAGGEAIGTTGVQLDSDFAVAALRFQNTGESDEVVVNGWSPGLPGTPKKQDHAGEGARNYICLLAVSIIMMAKRMGR